MNVALHNYKKIPLLLAAAFFLWGGSKLEAQTPTIQVLNVTVMKNTVYQHTFYHFSYATPPQINNEVSHGKNYFTPSSCCNEYGQGKGKKGVSGWNKLNNFYYEPDNGFVGRDTVIIGYWLPYGNGGNQQAYKIINFLVVPSNLSAADDYATTLAGQSIEIDVLANDTTNGTNLVIANIPNVNNGTAVDTNGHTKILFTPAAGFTGIANLNYTICDAQGSCDVATVSICVNPATQPAYDSVFITTNKNVPHVLLLDIDTSYSLVLPPAHGDLDTTMGALTYVPDVNYVGLDKVIYENTAGDVRIAEIRVLNVKGPNTYLFDDIVGTPLEEQIEEIHLLDNDNGSTYLVNVSVPGYPNTEEGGALVYLPQVGKGVYRYTPPAGFEGVDRFKYRAMPPNGSYDTAYCYIVVSDLNPAIPEFNMITPKNTPLVLGDHLPFQNYEYTQISAADLGVVTFYPGYNTVTSQHGQTFSGVNMLVYEPDVDATGADEFEFEYCPSGDPGNCQLVKVYLEIVDIPNPQAPVLCAGNQCVWPGDVTRDGKVDVRDVLPIGLTMGEVGLTRTNGSVNWYGQHATNWNNLYVTGLGYDVKYVDTDGNGIVSSVDTTAIGQFYGNYNNLTPEPAEAIGDLPFFIEEPVFPENPSIGDVFYAPIHLGNYANPAVNAYGLAFELLYDPAFFEVNVHFNDNAWMDYNSPILSMTHKPLPGKIDAAYTRTSGLAASGHGIIGVAEFIVIDDVNGNRPNSSSTKVTLNPLGLMNGSGQMSGLEGNSFTLEFGHDDNTGVQPVNESHLVVFPNPASEDFTLHLNGIGHEMERVMLYNMVGGLVYDSGSMTAKRMMVDVSTFTPGVYTVKVLANGEVLSKKIEVIR
ncbi:MAG: T9SS type A sorting domain-containing protein [Bacteroidetes bacterium]|nr:T9SS type A sorting domain-containing protein [Bacteroidota bacterium]